MMAGVRDLEEARAAFEPLRLQSYEYAPHRPGTHHFFKPRGHGGRTRTVCTSLSQAATSGGNALPSATPCEPIARWLRSTRP